MRFDSIDHLTDDNIQCSQTEHRITGSVKKINIIDYNSFVNTFQEVRLYRP